MHLALTAQKNIRKNVCNVRLRATTSAFEGQLSLLWIFVHHKRKFVYKTAFCEMIRIFVLWTTHYVPVLVRRSWVETSFELGYRRFPSWYSIRGMLLCRNKLMITGCVLFMLKYQSRLAITFLEQSYAAARAHCVSRNVTSHQRRSEQCRPIKM